MLCSGVIMDRWWCLKGLLRVKPVQIYMYLKGRVEGGNWPKFEEERGVTTNGFHFLFHENIRMNCFSTKFCLTLNSGLKDAFFFLTLDFVFIIDLFNFHCRQCPFSSE